MKKKLVTILLVVVIVFNFILCNCVYADLDDIARDVSRYGGDETIKGDAVQSLVESGTDSSGTTFKYNNFGVSIIGIIFQSIAVIIDVVPMTIQGILSIFTLDSNNTQNTVGNTIISFIGAGSNHYTIERTVFNEVALFNIDVFNFKVAYKNGIGSHTEVITQNSNIVKLKESVAGWFYTIRLLAMMINLCVLVYVGIRMALSSIASEEAKYKRMLIWWAESMVVLFFLQYIMYLIIYIGNLFLNIINALRYETIANGGLAVSFEDLIIDRIYLAFMVDSGTRFFLYSLFFWFLTALHIKFFLTYLKRTFTVFFLVVISPLITVTYPIDKLGNGRAEAFEIWMKELIINIVIQPIHAIVYLVFVYTAGKIAEKAPWVAMVFLLSLGRIENIIRNVFKITDSVDNVNMARKGGGKGAGIGGAIKMFIGKKGK